MSRQQDNALKNFQAVLAANPELQERGIMCSDCARRPTRK